ncbi:prepilin-type N-terminal cleavage/methylation domain-containing protein [Salinibacterium sp. ZJ70]|uniref:type IV pilus modification PilV family protein n=1 Tax=Salinibacterium sp. ZJ70 TaxID=2708084 RepID=UPI001423C72E|nr:prepilin-type N-terminal cleavage/methylation domain-containing protein [Salinibacterium sp. ZJ70]
MSRARTPRGDAGISLLEVIVALLVLSILVLASIGFVTQANTFSAYQQHNQVAVTVAGAAMERALATPPDQLASDRAQADVQAAFAQLAGRPNVGDTYPIWDNTVTGAPLVPITETQTFSGTEYEATTLIGTCHRPRNVVSGVTCGKVSGATALATPTGHLTLYRVTVVVTWTADDECPGGCAYETTSLIDATVGDVEWVD